MTIQEKLRTFINELELIEDLYILSFTGKAIELLPDYFFKAAATTSGKYHPQYAQGEGGLVRHTRAAVNIAACMFGNSSICGNFTSRDKDLIVSALILHDGLKSGLQQDNHTVKEHPILVTNYISDQFETLYQGEFNDIMMDVFPLIQSHMGQWNTNEDGKVILPLPVSDMAKYVHMCDYLASRKLIEINFNECIKCIV